MRIISNFKDYYDCMQANGFDPMIVYNRLKRPVPCPDTGSRQRYRVPYNWGNDTYEWQFSNHAIGFCGKWYLLFEIYGPNGEYDFKRGCTIPHCQAYTVEDVDKFVDKHFTKKQLDFYYENLDKWDRRKYGVFKKYDILESVKRFNQDIRVDDDKPFIQNNTPIICYHEPRQLTKPGEEAVLYNCTYDDCLKDYSFFKVMEPWQAYQELSMYVGGPLVNNRKVIPEMDNKTKIDSHGFDKWSFRSEPKVKK